jgi:hypothetical protein
MAVHTNEASLKVVTMIFEARYGEGYRYLDHSGELIVRITAGDPLWSVAAFGVQATRMKHLKTGINLNVNTEKIDLSLTEESTLGEGEKKAELLGKEAEKQYLLTVDTIKSPSTLRIGARFAFLAPADSLEDADRFLSKGVKSPLLDAVVASSKSDLWDAAAVFQIQEPETGYRRRLLLFSSVTKQTPGSVPYLGFPGDEGTGGALIDIDTYTRPDQGHLSKANMFFQDCYFKARRLAVDLFAWLLKQQR